VKAVRFSGGASGQPLRILLDFEDGRFALFDKDGKPVDGSAAEVQPPPVAPAPPPGGETAPQGAGQPEAPPSQP
jgi:hypothetical protein